MRTKSVNSPAAAHSLALDTIRDAERRIAADTTSPSGQELAVMRASRTRGDARHNKGRLS
jgi:hypothetical protein